MLHSQANVRAVFVHDVLFSLDEPSATNCGLIVESLRWLSSVFAAFYAAIEGRFAVNSLTQPGFLINALEIWTLAVHFHGEMPDICVAQWRTNRLWADAVDLAPYEPKTLDVRQGRQWSDRCRQIQ